MSDQPVTVRRPEIHAISDDPHAPFIYFDGVPTCGSNNNVINLTVSAARFMPAPSGNVAVDPVIVAHLRCSRETAIMLRDLIDKALLMGHMPTGVAN